MSLKFNNKGKIEAGTKQSKTTGLASTIFNMVEENTADNFTVIKKGKDLAYKTNEVYNLGTLKKIIFNLPNNPHNLVNPATGHTNAKVHSTARSLAVKQHMFNGTKQRLIAKRFYRGGSYEVIYFLESAYTSKLQEAIKNKDKEAVEMIKSKWEEISKLENAYPTI